VRDASGYLYGSGSPSPESSIVYLLLLGVWGKETLFKVEKAFLLPQAALSLGRRGSFTMPPSSVSPSTYFLMDSHSKSMYTFRAMFLPVCGNPCVFFGKTREKSDNLLPHLRIQRI
jgi:hypothetical protein